MINVYDPAFSTPRCEYRYAILVIKETLEVRLIKNVTNLLFNILVKFAFNNKKIRVIKFIQEETFNKGPELCGCPMIIKSSVCPSVRQLLCVAITKKSIYLRAFRLCKSVVYQMIEKRKVLVPMIEEQSR